MAEANHYCADCEIHFRDTIEGHAETYHGGGLFRGVEDGNWRDWERRQQFRV